jgi:hypothetical protein
MEEPGDVKKKYCPDATMSDRLACFVLEAESCIRG